MLKGIVAGELGALPERLAKLSDADRIAVLLKILPYVLPKVDAVGPSYGESSPSTMQMLDVDFV